MLLSRGISLATLCFGLMLTLVRADLRGADEIELRVDEDSYWAGRRAASFTEAAQAVAVAPPGVAWVERSELERAMNELSLAFWSGGEASGSLRLGHWLASDVLIRGDIAVNLDQRELYLEAIDLQRVDVLAACRIQFSPSPVPTNFTSEDIAAAGMVIESLTSSGPSDQREKILRILLENGADPDVQHFQFGHTPLHFAVERH